MTKITPLFVRIWPFIYDVIHEQHPRYF